MELYRSWWTAGIRSAFGCAHRVPRLKPSQKSLSGSRLPSNPFPLGFACCSSRIVGRGFDLRKEFMSVNSSSWPELTHKRLVRELRRSFVFENNHPVKDKNLTRTLNIWIVLSFFCWSRVILEALACFDDFRHWFTPLQWSCSFLSPLKKLWKLRTSYCSLVVNRSLQSHCFIHSIVRIVTVWFDA